MSPFNSREQPHCYTSFLPPSPHVPPSSSLLTFLRVSSRSLSSSFSLHALSFFLPSSSLFFPLTSASSSHPTFPSLSSLSFHILYPTKFLSSSHPLTLNFPHITSLPLTAIPSPPFQFTSHYNPTLLHILTLPLLYHNFSFLLLSHRYILSYFSFTAFFLPLLPLSFPSPRAGEMRGVTLPPLAC